ncbi:histone-lysine N-methyltransferase, putative [Plasmodium malariae]|uniref:Histone-lysine N-methyltransferase, putative n=1 Tax=Plasmodium malariae TaxID=5858 RepID=A0A1C3L2Q6_PLAMA|nr:histone-lysine N-methyltransferase, putative [Plasmodium malariae]
MVVFKRIFHNYFARNALTNILKKEEINFNDLHKRVYIGRSDYNGLGIFSLSKIKRNEIIEICPTVKIENEDIPKKLINYLFEKKEQNMNKQIVQILTKKDETANYKLFPLGYGILYNHSNSPNAFVHIVRINKEKVNINIFTETVVSSQIMIFRAQRDIQKNEEIFISYGQCWWRVS